MLPTSLDPATLRTIGLVAFGLLVVLALVVMRIVQRMVFKVVLLGFLAGIGVFVWWQRDELRRCVPTCSCSLAGRTVQVPGCPVIPGAAPRSLRSRPSPPGVPVAFPLSVSVRSAATGP